MKRLLSLAMLACCILLMASSAFAAAKTYVVLPFAVNGPDGYKYLEKSIPPMFSSRLHWEGHYQVSPNQARTAAKVPANESEARQAMLSSGADYAVWGTVTIVGDECSLDAMVLSKSGEKWTQSRQTRVAQLIPTLTGISDSINTQVFKRSAVPNATAQGGSDGYAPGKRPLNPSIEFSGSNAGTETRLRSNQLKIVAQGMEVCDADGDGNNEVFLFDEYNLYAYRFQNNTLVQLGKIRTQLNQSNISIRSFDFSNSGRPWIIITSVDSSQMPHSRIYSFDGKNFKIEIDNVDYYLNVINDLGTGRPKLIGQLGHERDMFRKGSLCEMVKSGNTLIPGPSIPLGNDFNVYNFTYVPAGRSVSTQALLLNVTKMDKLRVYSLSGSLMSESEEMYSGSPVGLNVKVGPKGLGEDTETVQSMYYIPMRMLVTDLDRDGNYEVIVNQPITIAGQIFRRYRNFIQAQIQCLYWDGVGMSQQWRTKTIKGGVVDIALTDLNNDGILDLVICINTGGTMVQKRTMVVAYPLDLGSINAVDSDLIKEGR